MHWKWPRRDCDICRRQLGSCEVDLQNPYQGFLNLMNGYCAQWFRESTHLEQYEQSIQELEALL